MIALPARVSFTHSGAVGPNSEVEPAASPLVARLISAIPLEGVISTPANAAPALVSRKLGM